MEIIIFIAVVVVLALLWSGYVKTKKAESDQTIDNWQPPKAEDKPWPYGEKVAEGKIHVKVADVAPVVQDTADIAIAQMPDPKSSAYRVETPAPVAEPAPAKKPAAKKAPAKKAAEPKPAAKKAPAKKKSV